MNRYIAKHIVYPLLLRLRQQNFNHVVQSYEEIQYKSSESIESIQSNKLRAIIKYAYEHLPFYKKIFDRLGLTVADFVTLNDLQKLPVLSKRDILENETRLINPDYSGKVYTRKTGGSTGMTLHFQKDSNALALNEAIMWRCYQWYGIGVGDRQVRFWGVPVTSSLRWKESLKDYLLNRIRISAFDISESSCLQQYKEIKKFNPDYFYGYTTAIYGFCLYMKKLGIDLKSLKLKAIICTAEKMYPHHLELFNEVFDCPVVDEYGSSETGIIAFQCKEGNMHLMTDHLCIEFLDENDMQVDAGELGRVVVTDLATLAMPLLRYDIGDIGKPSAKKCSCGVNLPLMEIVEGRKEDFIRTKDDKLVHAAYLCYTLKDDSVHEFKMYQKDINRLNVIIVKSPSYNENTENILEEKLRTSLGNEMQINFEYCERIPREKSGKLRYFVSEISEH